MMRRVGIIAMVVSALAVHSAACQSPAATALDRRPAVVAAGFAGLVGEYGPDANLHIVRERDGQLELVVSHTTMVLRDDGGDAFAGTHPDGSAARVSFVRRSDGRAVRLTVGSVSLARNVLGPESGNQLTVTPIRPLADLRREALAASPPAEKGPFKPTDLVELVALDPTIKLEIRYATNNNFLGTPFYTQARAFMQRPAAEAVVRANRSLAPFGFGLLIHDAYRPWYVTKMFWDATPNDKHIFVANPADGSRHNRGEAVDLTLYDLATGQPIEMVGTYDETTVRSAPDYPGGTSLQRWHRGVLRRAMEMQGFSVNENEWWHFDYRDWRQYAIGNVAFENIH